MKTLIKTLLVSFGIMVFAMYLFVDIEEHQGDQPAFAECEEISYQDSISLLVTHNRSWIEYMKNTGFCSIYNATYKDAEDGEFSRNNIAVVDWIDESDYWQQVYSTLYYDSKDHMQSLQDSLLRIGREHNLDREDFARMVVAFVQDIPYEYVLPENCTGTEVSPCNGNVSFGLYSPVEFLYAMHGDCDTRTVFLYTLLRNFGYEPLIVNSREYLHSMLALDIASSGEDFEYNGKKYAFWETTNVGWLAGMLPPDMNNKDYWSVALDYELENNVVGDH